MRLRNVKNAEEILKNSKYYISNPEENKGKWNSIFENDKPIMLEIGMGKGDFIKGMALLRPEYNWIGLEKYESVLVRGVQKLDKDELQNVRVVRFEAENLSDIFDHEVDTIFLNFSDPWPKKRHYKRRLTYREFLKTYDACFKSNAKIEMKTDNDGLFESSLVELSHNGYKLDEVILDLEASGKDNVKTEYEIKFGSKGFKIKYLKASKK